MSKSNDRVPIGKIVSTFGLRGQLKVEPLTNIFERFNVGKILFLQDEPRKILSSRLQKNQFILELEGIRKIEQAEALKWQLLTIPSSDRPELEEDEYLVDDLIGLTVITVDGKELGVVNEVQEFPAHDVLVVGELMIPAISEFVEEVDFDNETITVRLIEGMLEEQA